VDGAETQAFGFSDEFKARVTALFPDVEQYRFLHRALKKGRSVEVRQAIFGEKARPLPLELMYQGLMAEHGSPTYKEAVTVVERHREIDALYDLIIRNDYP